MTPVQIGGLAILAFFCGSIPTGYIIGRRRGIDIREHGSKNIGATNVGRVLGRRAGLTCFGLDMLKGFAPTIAAGIAGGWLGSSSIEPRDGWSWLLVMAMPVIGHMFCPWLNFKGGKGVATALGALLAVFPLLTIGAVGTAIIWITTLSVCGYVGLSSCLAALGLPLIVAATFAFTRSADAPWSHATPFLTVTSLLAALVIYKHRANLARTFKGTESRVTWMGPGRKKRKI